MTAWNYSFLSVASSPFFSWGFIIIIIIYKMGPINTNRPEPFEDEMRWSIPSLTPGSWRAVREVDILPNNLHWTERQQEKADCAERLVFKFGLISYIVTSIQRNSKYSNTEDRACPLNKQGGCSVHAGRCGWARSTWKTAQDRCQGPQKCPYPLMCPKGSA